MIATRHGKARSRRLPLLSSGEARCHAERPGGGGGSRRPRRMAGKWERRQSATVRQRMVHDAHGLRSHWFERSRVSFEQVTAVDLLAAMR